MKLPCFFLLVVGVSLSACATAQVAPTLPVVTASAAPTSTAANLPEPTPTAGTTASPTEARVFVSVSDTTNVRNGPSTNAAVVGQLTTNQQYPVLGRSGEWWQIQLDGQTAWVYSGLTKIIGDASGFTDLQAAPTVAALATPLNQSEAQANIRKFLERPDLDLTFMGPAHMINSPDGDLKVWQYTDDTGRVYLVEAATGRLVQIDPPQGLTHSSVAPLYSAAELQTRAEALMTANVPEFAGPKPNLDFEASDKSNSIFFFRWNDLQATGWKMNRPFAQVALAGDGTLVSYYNTLHLR